MDLFGITLSLVSSLCSGTHHALMRKAGYRIHTTHNVMMVGIFITLISCIFMPIFDFHISPL
jgi:drug/metabolite transporter (DMT)-like permease